jgi:predicted ATP-binding protein involved in virulence
MTLIRGVAIENYKSIRKLGLDLGRVNVLIGANGSGKSNILDPVVVDLQMPGALGWRITIDPERRAVVPASGAS